MNGGAKRMGVQGLILAAIGCGRLRSALEIASREPFVVFATLDSSLAGIQPGIEAKVHFYETG
jgi:AmiR/NasT family two-component response regulator